MRAVSDSALFIGMISGTSRDGADAALVHFDDNHMEVIEAICLPYPSGLAEALERLVRSGQRPGKSTQESLDEQLADHFSKAAEDLLETAGVSPGDVSAIGSHGQTVWHDPDAAAPESIQLGSPERIARKAGITTVGDFRRADIEAGGQGAPLAPLLHRALFRPQTGTRVVLNLGGIANISIIDETGDVSGFDTGPANCLLDAWTSRHRGAAFDRDGQWAASGRVIPSLQQAMLADGYFVKTAPKSTGTEYFNLNWLDLYLNKCEYEPSDVQATLAELSAVTAADSIRPQQPIDVLVCGGGVHNAFLLERLQVHLPGVRLRSTAELGLDPDCVEAVLFAWLARERLAGRRLDTCRITGARSPVLLGRVARDGAPDEPSPIR